jgi:enoyl-CoA hydratase/carnithine racemase
MRRVMQYAHEFTPPGRAALAVGKIKRAAQNAGEVGLEQGLALERELQAELFASGDAKEGLVAFTSKRKPVFRGR